MSTVTEKLESQIILCKCGGVVAACRTPDCYEDTDWMKSVRQYAKKGYVIEVRDHGLWKFGCKCKELEAARKAATEPELFQQSGQK
jgi:hypothetical protein